MANHVNSYIQLEEGNEGAKAYFKSFVESMGTWEDSPMDGIEKLFGPRESEEQSDYSYFIENVGAKWLTVEDSGDEHLMTTTAWSPPEGLFNKICEDLAEIDESVQVSMVFDDEMPNFVGVATFNAKFDDEPDYTTLDTEEYQEELGSVAFSEDYVICETFGIEEDNEDEIWEKRDELRDEFWEAWSEYHMNIIHEAFSEEREY